MHHGSPTTTFTGRHGLTGGLTDRSSPLVSGHPTVIHRRPPTVRHAVPNDCRSRCVRVRTVPVMTTSTSTLPVVDHDDVLPAAIRWRDDLHAAPAPAVTSMASWTCTWETGPDAGGSVVVGTERLLIGRAAGAEVRCDDPALEPHHALLVPDGDQVRLLQLTGRTPLTVNGRPIDGRVVVDAVAVVEIGHSTLRVQRTQVTDRAAAHVRDGVVLRGPRAVPAWDPPPLRTPTVERCRARPAGRPGSRAGRRGGRRSAGRRHAPADVPRVRRTRRCRRHRQLGGPARRCRPPDEKVAAGHGARPCRAGHRHRRARRGLRRTRPFVHLHGGHRPVDDHGARRTAVGPTGRPCRCVRGLARRRRRAPGAHRSTATTANAVPVLHLAGHADAPMSPLGTTWLRDQPLTVELGPGMRLALRGAAAATSAVARSVVLQLAANCGPGDVRIVVVTERPGDWRWTSGLPHGATPLLATAADLAEQLATCVRPAARTSSSSPTSPSSSGHARQSCVACSPRRTGRVRRSSSSARTAHSPRCAPPRSPARPPPGPARRRARCGSPTSARVRCRRRSASPASVTPRRPAPSPALHGLVDPDDPNGPASLPARAPVVGRAPRRLRAADADRHRGTLACRGRRPPTHLDRRRRRRHRRHRPGARRPARPDRRHHGFGQERAVAQPRGGDGGAPESGPPDASCSSTTRAARRSTPAPSCRTSSAWSPTSTSNSPTAPCAACTPSCAAASGPCATTASPISPPARGRTGRRPSPAWWW